MNETEFRHRLFELAEDAPRGTSAPPALLRRARRRVVRTIAASVAIAVLVVGMGIAGVRALQAAPTPAGPPPTPTAVGLGSLAYAVDGDIYVAEWDGSNPVRIADGRPPIDCGDGAINGLGEYFAFGPIWSPDGRYLAYRQADCDGPQDAWWNVVISDPQGNVVTSFPSEGWGIKWSPDSTRVAVWFHWGEEPRTIGIYGIDGERQSLLTLTRVIQSGDADPVWAPDGESLVLGHFEIPLDGTPTRRLRTEEGTYSPDGSRVAYTTRTRVIIAAADGSHPQEVFGERVRSLAWSPTSDRIAFTSWDATELLLIDVPTGTVTLLANVDGSDVLLYIAGGAFEFSPEGDRILFSRTEDEGTGASSLWSVNADGSDLRRLVAGTALGDWLSPSPTP
jgi:Tol biopolymer transport system component